MTITAKTNKLVWVKSSGKCAICKEKLIQRGVLKNKHHFLGEVAHIVAEKQNGPRGESTLTSSERNAESNLILLCVKHHKIIDDDTSTYTVDKLQHLKKMHEIWIDARFKESEEWQPSLQYLSYINLYRIYRLFPSIINKIKNYKLSTYAGLHEMGLSLIYLMNDVEKLIQSETFWTEDIEKALEKPENMKGINVSFNHRFRTRNIIMPREKKQYEHVFTYDLNKDPHIYIKLKGYKIIALIDKRWITTSTAFCEFRPTAGHSVFSGIGYVKQVDIANKKIIVSMYFLGLPHNPCSLTFD